MKKLILSQLFVSILFIATSFGQTEKGSYLLGGNASFSLQFNKFDDYKSINLNPDLAYFLKDNLALGIKIPLSIEGYNSYMYNIIYGVNAFSRYYFAKTDHSSFFSSVNFGMLRIDHNEYSTYNDIGYTAGLGLGFTLFLNKSIGLETELLYDYNKYNHSEGHDNLGINFGFQIYFNK